MAKESNKIGLKLALYEAVDSHVCDIDFVKRLLEAGASPDIQDGSTGYTPLHIAAITRQDKVLKLLLEHEDSKNILDKGDMSGDTPLIFAAGNPLTVNAELLLEAGARVNVANNDGRTALHRAAIMGNPKLVKLLVEHGADPFVKDSHGRTPCYYAELYLTVNNLDPFRDDPKRAEPFPAEMKEQKQKALDLLEKTQAYVSLIKSDDAMEVEYKPGCLFPKGFFSEFFPEDAAGSAAAGVTGAIDHVDGHA